jgi:hypothetical protein
MKKQGQSHYINKSSPNILKIIINENLFVKIPSLPMNVNVPPSGHIGLHNGGLSLMDNLVIEIFIIKM